MKVTVDLNVLLEVAQNRIPHYEASEEVLHRAREREYDVILPGHAITTLHYIIEKSSATKLANDVIDGFLADFVVHPSDKADFRRARQLPIKDFEDALVASVAEAMESDYIVTRNVPDFAGSSIPAVTPSEFFEAIVEIEDD